MILVRGIAVFVVGIAAGCSSKSAVPCSAQSGCEAFAGTICANGFCRLPSELDLGSSDLSGLFSPMDQSTSPADMVGFCGGDAGAASCPPSMPFCGTDSYCRACVASDAPVCTSENVTTPRCDATTGGCAACRPAFTAVDCPDAKLNQCSFDGSCRQACTAHSDCASGMCDMGVLNTGGQGVCARADEIVYLQGSLDCTGADGSMGKPFCTLASAMAARPTGGFIWVLSSATSIRGSSKITAPYVILGHGSASFTTVDNTTIIDVQSGARAYLESVTVSEAYLGAVGCTGGSLTMKHVSITGNGYFGVSTMQCTVDVDSTWIQTSGNGFLATGGTVTLTNSLITDNAGVGVTIGAGTVAHLDYLTIANNKPPTSTVTGALSCGSTVTVRNSIVWGNQAASGQSWSGDCVFTSSDVDSAIAGSTNFSVAPVFTSYKTITGINQPISFVVTYHLVTPNGNNSACCIDQAVAIPGITTDFDGDTRPKGLGPDIGADEAQ